MIIVINSQGGLVSRQVEDIYQGSNNVNVINVVAPFSSNVVLKAMFEMPDGTYKPKNGDGYILTPSIEIIEGLNTWRLDVDFPITQYSGLVKMQLRAILGSEILATSTIKFPVQQGVPYESEHIEEGTYEYLLALINDLKGLINDKVDIKHYKYSLAENINEDSVGVYYIIDPDTGKYAPKILPEEYEDETHYYEIIAESYVSNTNDGLFLEFKDNIAEQSMRLEITANDITINGKPVVFEEDLIAENIQYNNANSGMSATDVKQAIDELKFGLNAIETTQVVSLGNKTILASDWVADGGLWKYEFRNEVFGDSLVQELIMTPNNEAIENLNNNDILIYPQVYQYQESEKVAVGVIKASKKPDFDMVFDVKIQGISINTSSEGIRASQIVFTASESIPKTNVQEAVMQVQTNLDTLRVQYETEKTDFATLDNNGKIPSSQLPSYVDDVIECYTIDGVAPMTRGWLSETPGGVALLPLSGKIYVVVSDNEYQNKQYRWSGSVYAIISESLALGETSSTAYSGAKGKANADAIWDLRIDVAVLEQKTSKGIKEILLWENTENDTTAKEVVLAETEDFRLKIQCAYNFEWHFYDDDITLHFKGQNTFEYFPNENTELFSPLRSTLGSTFTYLAEPLLRCYVNHSDVNTKTIISLSIIKPIVFKITDEETVQALYPNFKISSGFYINKIYKIVEEE